MADYDDDGGPYRPGSRSGDSRSGSRSPPPLQRRSYRYDHPPSSDSDSRSRRSSERYESSFFDSGRSFSRFEERSDGSAEVHNYHSGRSEARSDEERTGRARVRFDGAAPAHDGGGGSAPSCRGCAEASAKLDRVTRALESMTALVQSAKRDLARAPGEASPVLSPDALASIGQQGAADAVGGGEVPAAGGPGPRKYSVVGTAGDPWSNVPQRRRRSTVKPWDADVESGRGSDPAAAAKIAASKSGAKKSQPGQLAATASIASIDRADNDEEPTTTCNRRWMIHPNRAFRRNWDTLIAFCLLYNAVSLPFRVCFDVPAVGAFRYIETMIDVLVATDIVFNFRTAFFDQEGILITNPRLVALQYLKTWFLLDFLATFPYDVIIINAIEGDSIDDRASVLRLPRLIRLARLIRLVRLLRLFRLTRIFQKYQDQLDKYHGLMTTIKLAVVTLMASHFYACFWFLLTSLESFAPDTWGGAYGISETNLSNQYISSMHFAIQSITTVGYGDIVPQNDGERLFVVIAMLLGITVFGYSIGSIIALIVAHDQRRSRFLEKMRSINNWIEYRDIPPATASRIRAYFRHAHQTTNVQIEEQNILKELSNTLRTEVSMLLNENILRGVPFMTDASTTAITAIIMKLKPKSTRAGQDIITAGEVGSEMYVLVRGSAQVVSADGNIILATLEEGSFFGEIALIHAIPRTATVRAVTRCELLTLSKHDFQPLLDEFPELKSAFTLEARKRMAANLKKEEDSTVEMEQDPAVLQISRSMSLTHMYGSESHLSDEN